MRLSDIMSGLGLAGYAEVGLILFLGAFLAVAGSLWSGRRAEWEQYGRLPLEDGEQPPAPEAHDFGSEGAPHS